MAKKRARRVHEVRAELYNCELVKAGSSLSLAIFAEGEKLGAMEIGRGSLFWYGRKKQKGTRIDWSEFAEMMDELAYG